MWLFTNEALSAWNWSVSMVLSFNFLNHLRLGEGSFWAKAFKKARTHAPRSESFSKSSHDQLSCTPIFVFNHPLFCKWIKFDFCFTNVTHKFACELYFRKNLLIKKTNKIPNTNKGHHQLCDKKNHPIKGSSCRLNIKKKPSSTALDKSPLWGFIGSAAYRLNRIQQTASTKHPLHHSDKNNAIKP